MVFLTSSISNEIITVLLNVFSIFHITLNFVFFLCKLSISWSIELKHCSTETFPKGKRSHYIALFSHETPITKSSHNTEVCTQPHVKKNQNKPLVISKFSSANVDLALHFAFTGFINVGCLTLLTCAAAPPLSDVGSNEQLQKSWHALPTVHALSGHFTKHKCTFIILNNAPLLLILR